MRFYFYSTYCFDEPLSDQMTIRESIPGEERIVVDRLTARISSRYLSYALPFLYLITSIAFYLHTYDSAQVKITLVQMGGIVLAGFWYVSLACDWEKQWDKYARVALPLLLCLASGRPFFLACGLPRAEPGRVSAARVLYSFRA